VAPSPVNIRWTAQAADDFQSVYEFAGKTSTKSADALIDRILSDIDFLELPYLGRSGRVEGTRELVIVHTPFIVVYRLRHDQAEILGILHGARKWPASF
jgi:toxin ParE1/3/4